MRLAALEELYVALVRLAKAVGKDALLIEHFNRIPKHNVWLRKATVSALTLLGLDEVTARFASYETFAETIHHRFTNPKKISQGSVLESLLTGHLCWKRQPIEQAGF